MRALDLHTVGRLRRDAVLRFPYTGPHERRPGRKKQFDGCFNRRDPARMARTTLKKAKVDLYHVRLHYRVTRHAFSAAGTDLHPRMGLPTCLTAALTRKRRIVRALRYQPTLTM